MAPGNSPGTLTVDGDVDWSGAVAGGTYLWEVTDATGTAGSDPGWDLISITGTLDLSGAGSRTINVLGAPGQPLNLTINPPGTVTFFEVIRAGSLNLGGLGALPGLNRLGGITITGGVPGPGFWNAWYNGGSIYLAFTSGPEPGTYQLFALLLVGGLTHLRRKTS
jgi:hypothetical protein